MLLTKIKTAGISLNKFLETNKHTSKIYAIFTLRDISSIEIQRKQILVYIFLAIGVSIGFIFTIINYLNKEYIVIAIDLLILISAIALFPFIKAQKTFKITSLSLVTVFYLLVTALLVISYKNQFYSLWFLATPPVFIFLIGNKWGTLTSLTHLSIFVLEYNYFNTHYHYQKAYFHRVIAIYLIILILILIYEYTRKTVQTSLHLHQNLLDNTISKLDKQQIEYIKIMKNVNDGIFLLDQNLRIKSPYSTAFKDIISVKFITVGVPFITLLEDKIFKSKLIQLEHYLSEIIQTGRIPLKTINPIQKIIIHCNRHQEHKVKTLAFSFTTIPLKGGKHEILGTVIDISKEVNLEKKITEQKTKKIQEVERLMNIIRIHPEDLNEFIKGTRQKLATLKKQIQETNYDFELHRHSTLARKTQEHPHLELIIHILSELHAIKGNASVIGFIGFAELTHRHEAEIQTLKAAFIKKDCLLDSQQRQLSTLIEKLQQEVTTTERIVYKLGEFNYRYTKLSKKFGSKFLNFLYRAIQTSKKEYHPPIKLASEDFDETIFIHHEQFYETIKNIFILLIKNSLVHGIESLVERKTLAKSETATIKITNTILENGMLALTYSDDGKGIALDRIREQLRKNDSYSEDQIRALSATELYAYIFRKEFSTHQTVSLDSGRGMGMYFVKNIVEKLGGNIEITSEQGTGMKLAFLLPLPQAEQKQEPQTLPAYG